MTSIVTIILVMAALLQLVAAVLALRAIPRSGRYRYPWIALSLALVLMIERRIVPLYDVRDGIANLTDALFALLISALMIFSLIGLDRLLRAIRRDQEQLARLAITDSLTGLANRRHLFAELEREVRRASRSRQPLSVLMMDLDHFKAVNDQYGHAVGDQVLVAMAGRCLARLRTTDICGRIGGEEFVALLPDTDADGAAIMAERLCSDVGEVPLADTAGGPLAVTISIGVATYHLPSLPVDEAAGGNAVGHAQDLLRCADLALYQAKASGRNCVQGYVGDSATIDQIVAGAGE